MPKKPKPDRDVVGPPAEGGHAEAKDDEAARKREAKAEKKAEKTPAPAAAPAAPRGFGERFSRGRRLVFGADDEAVNAPAPPPEAPVPPVTATVGFLPA